MNFSNETKEGLLTATLLISSDELPKTWLEKVLELLPENVQVQLFFVNTGTRLVGEKLEKHPYGERKFCAHSHRQLNGPKPVAGIHSGGLINLGEMIAKSEYTVSIPHTIIPLRYASHKLKKIAIFLDSDIERGVEGFRVATGLAGCKHMVTMFCPGDIFPITDGIPQVPDAAKPYLEMLPALGVKFLPRPTAYDDSEYDVLISV